MARAQEEIRAERDRVFQELRTQVGEIAVELVQSEVNIAGGMMNMRSLRVDAGPGHPPCARCHTPLDIELDGFVVRRSAPS